jgi:hypothetical protein
MPCRRLRCAAEICVTRNPKIVVRYGMEGRAQLVDDGRPERNSKLSEAERSGVKYLGIKTQ